ncbi:MULTISPECIES: class I SAM-dependent methyltransferase [Flavobacteriaceae]|uniref:S-adenosylmethionine-dependent methyltransferase n=2 Tax=Flavobacteriaceae TaxID=49546 RepID=A3XIY3_LEEBM|nr:MULTISPECIES: class I SAM-dependent methyltransferase [Flavobacteriaceae]ADF52125.1 S-adenosylmethionine-dependent methyltransferase [Zunongwangia profunda SM-A87]EAQ50490.1 S-adenosylmethionine-dependent methyltransferase [Leeuwenhoekiella blandensis MED217]
MNYKNTFNLIGNVDIYVIDQILKGRYQEGQSILDAGCGKGRNLKWSYQNDFELYGIDKDVDFLAFAKAEYPEYGKNFSVGSLDKLPYDQNSFDHILCCAVLHFAQSQTQFTAMFSELVRVLKPNGSLLIRMASNIGLDGNAPEITYKENGQKGTYYLTRERIENLLKEFTVELIEPVKTTNVQDERAMTTLVFKKKS